MIPLRAWIVPALALAVLLTVCTRARAADLPPGVDCQLIREFVAKHGRVVAVKWARDEGYSWAQINAARRCLR